MNEILIVYLLLCTAVVVYATGSETKGSETMMQLGSICSYSRKNNKKRTNIRVAGSVCVTVFARGTWIFCADPLCIFLICLLVLVRNDILCSALNRSTVVITSELLSASRW